MKNITFIMIMMAVMGATIAQTDCGTVTDYDGNESGIFLTARHWH